jgi:hypothetical protein
MRLDGADHVADLRTKVIRGYLTGLVVPAAKQGRIAEPLAKNPLTGGPNEVMLDVKIQLLNDSGRGGVSTAADNLRQAVRQLSDPRYLHGDEIGW